MEQKPEIQENPNAKKLIIKEPDIYFKKVSFGYNSQERVLKNLEFKIDKGVCALVGPSGCGKTTILNLLLRLYEPQEGQIFIGGQNIRDLYLLREQISVAPQEPFLWNDTVGNNIRYAKEDASEEEIIEAAELSGVSEFVKSLPCGYSTVIGENACKLSEGQKQKIAIARGLIKKPKILILDEAMSSMDSLSEEKIIAQIRKVSWRHTVIIVSHRLSAVMVCDLVYFLKKPDTMIIDSPHRLIEKNTDFYNLFAAQIENTESKKILSAPTV